VLVDIDMISALPNQILVERHDFAFITYIEFERLPPFVLFTQGHDIFKCIQHPGNLHNTTKSFIVLSKSIVVQY